MNSFLIFTFSVMKEEDEDEEEAVYHCENCGHDNTEPERNADGNLECAECGEILPESVSMVHSHEVYVRNILA